uniref:M6 family metalloprotease domain-containing protein n=1 Tax=uncultured Draconibacterium sp. TaxID=1573823 RepID=UPI0032177FA2
MQQKILHTLFFILVFSIGNAQNISQLNPLSFQIEQGNYISTINRKGDYANHWLETDEGYRVFQKDRIFEYAIKDSGIWKTSGIAVSEKPDAWLKAFLEENSKYSGKQNSEVLLLKSGSGVGGVPATGEVKLPVICVEYSDLKHSRTVEDIERMFNQDGYKGNLSLAEYFKLSSHGKINLSFDVVGWVNANEAHTVYSEEKGMYKAGYLAKKAINEAKSLGIDFSEYDNDNDGDVDCVIIVHAGLGAEEIGDEKYIWAHSWSLSGTGAGALTIDGKTIDSYNIGCELRRSSNAGIGMKCHELGHTMGLPDLYDGTGKSNGLGYWCMMAAGPWLNEARPGNFSAWCRVKLGWEVPLVLRSDEEENLCLSASSNANQLVRVNTTNPNEYYLFENRQKKGIDYRLPGTGLAIYHCNEQKLKSDAAINNDRDNPGIRLVEADFNIADGLYNAKDRGAAGDLFPGSKEVTSFNAESIPSSNLFNGDYSGVNIQSIKETNDTVTFKLVKSTPKLLATTSVFRESPENKGQISNIAEINLLGVKWAFQPGILSSEKYSLSNIPEGLVCNIQLQDSTSAILSMEGCALSHDSVHSVNDLVLQFKDDIFATSGEFETLTDSLMFQVRFRDPYDQNVIWHEGFELYDENETPDNWIVEMKTGEGMKWTVTNTEQIHCDVAEFTCSPAVGNRCLKSVENWFGNGSSEFRLISPEIDFSEMVAPKLSFDEIRGWDNSWPDTKPIHYINIEFSEDKVNWQTISTLAFSQENIEDWQNSGLVSLGAAAGKTGFVAFKSNSHTYFWEIDNVTIHTGGVGVANMSGTDTKVYPNPVKDNLWIESSNQLKNAELFNIHGTVTGFFDLSGNRNKINVSGMMPGIYFLRITDFNGKSNICKIKID